MEHSQTECSLNQPKPVGVEQIDMLSIDRNSGLINIPGSWHEAVDSDHLSL